jgi:C_GCAxxG_C_C family probable redox protein
LNKSTEAKGLFDRGFNCAQSMLFTFGREYFKEDNFALKLTSGFGAGISHRGEMCGAVSGSLMIIGLRYGSCDPLDELAEEISFMISKEFLQAFEKKNGSLHCSRLLKAEINTPEGYVYATENELFKKICPCLLESASCILESLFQKYPVNKLNS